MGLDFVQEQEKVFESANDVLCFGVGDVDVEYLRGLGVEVTVFDPLSTLEPSGRFNVLVVGRKMSVFALFALIEKSMEMLLANSKILAKIDVEGELVDVKNMVAKLAGTLALQPEAYVETPDGDVWLYLSRLR